MLGNLQRQLLALAFHFGQYSSRLSFTPYKVAFLACPSRQLPSIPSVTHINILVQSTNKLTWIASFYAQITGISVQAFTLRPCDLGISSSNYLECLKIKSLKLSCDSAYLLYTWVSWPPVKGGIDRIHCNYDIEGIVWTPICFEKPQSIFHLPERWPHVAR